MARAQGWDLILGSRLVLLLEQLLLAPRVSQVNATVGHNLTWKVLITTGVGVDREASFLCYEEVLFCIAVHDSFFLMCTCLKFIERGFFFFSKHEWWFCGGLLVMPLKVSFL